MDSIMSGHHVSPSVTDTESETKSSRFSADSIHEVEAPANKSGNRSTMMSVKSIKKLWRRSNKQSVSMPSGHGQVPGKLSPQNGTAPAAVPPIRTDRSASISSQTAPLKSPTFGGPGRLQPPSAPMPQNPLPQRPERPSQENLDIPDIPDHQLKIPTHPPLASRLPGPSPIIPSKMLPVSRSGTPLDRLHFDQESPYPMPARRPTYSSQPPSQPQPQQIPAPVTSLPDSQKNNVRKSILKWKSAAAGGQHQSTSSISSMTTSTSQASPSLSAGAGGPAPSSQPRPQSAARPRRPSVLNFGSTRGSVSGPSPPPEIPPSPPIPEQFLANNGRLTPAAVNRPNSHLTNPSTDSSHSSQRKSSLTRSVSPASSRLSEDTRPSIDSSQFEMVSPKMGSLSYPYDTLNQ